MNDLTAFQRDLLFVVASRDGAKGLEIKEVMDEYYGTDIHHGRLYPNLDVLDEKGLIEKGSIDKRTNSYSLTDRGRRELSARKEWEAERFEVEGSSATA